MYDWLPSLDKIHSHFQMKGFSPMLDENLIKFASHIPIEEKYDIDKNLGKLILRQLLKTKKYKSEFSKRGFSPDLITFWNHHGKEITKTYLQDARIVKDSWINSNWIKSAFVKSDSDVRYLTKLLSVLGFEIWYRVFVTKEMKYSEELT
jgi:asparagine synthase (glutamine-hydrolysing)